MNKFLLYLVMMPKALWSGMGADVLQLQAILSTKLKMDDRKPVAFGRPQRQTKKAAKYTSTITMIFSLFMGLMYAGILYIFDNNPVVSLTVFFSIMMAFLTFSLIVDFSSVLIDTRDKLILFTKPVGDRTIFLSRLLHIFIYFFRIVFPMTLPAWIVFGLLHGWRGALFFPLPLMLMTLLCLFLVIGCYMLILAIAKPQRFKEVINFFQIGFSVLLFSFYFLPRLLANDAVLNINIANISWIKYFPSYWIASCWWWVDGKAALVPHTQWMSFVALLLPFVLLWVTVKFLAPSFIAGISGLDGVEVMKPNKTKGAKTNKGKLYVALANILNKNDAAKAGFMITWLQSSRSRTFRMRVYPMFAFVPMYFVYLLSMDKSSSMSAIFEHLSETNYHLLLLYMTGTVIMNAINFVIMSEQYKASWIYYSAPVQTPGNILSGSFKAIWVKYFFPFIAIIGAFVIYVWGPSKILDVLLAGVNVTLYIICMMRVNNRSLPFSMPEQMKNTGGKTIVRVFFVFILMGALGFGHYLASFFWWLKLLFLVLSGIFTWLVWDGYNNTDWNGIKAAEEAY